MRATLLKSCRKNAVGDLMERFLKFLDWKWLPSIALLALLGNEYLGKVFSMVAFWLGFSTDNNAKLVYL